MCRTLHTGLATRAAEAASGGSSSSSPEAQRLQHALAQLWVQVMVDPVYASLLLLLTNSSQSLEKEMISRQEQQQRQQQQQPSRAGARRLLAASDARLVRLKALWKEIVCKLGAG